MEGRAIVPFIPPNHVHLCKYTLAQQKANIQPVRWLMAGVDLI
jgi:hypothetical protein